MKFFAAAFLATTANAISNEACLKQDSAIRHEVQFRLDAMGVACEEMCKRVGSYPNCQCPGFAGQPATDSDTRACFTKWCQDPAPERQCPNDEFVNCVDGTTAVSAMQWPALLEVFSGLMHWNPKSKKAALVSVKEHAITTANATSCEAMDLTNRHMIQSMVALMGPECETMCKRVGSYPNCECPGFAGQPASDFDTRACFAKWCQDPNPERQCPNDEFVGCVKGTTAVSALQWPTLLSRMSRFIKNSHRMLIHKK